MRFIFLLAAILFAPSLSLAANIYEVKDITITQPSTDQTKSREKAMEEAQKRAFDELQKKLIDGGFITKKQDLPANRIATLVDSIDVIGEKITAKSYKATYNVTFSNTEVSKLFAINNIAPVVEPEKYLVVPIVVEKAAVKIWKNDWWKTWNVDKKSTVILPLGDLQDIQNLKNEDIAANKYDGMFRMQKRYGATNVVLIQAEYIEAKNSLDVQLENIKGENRIVINYEYPGGAGISKEDLFEAAANDLSYRLESNKLTDESLVTSANPTEAPALADLQPLNHLSEASFANPNPIPASTGAADPSAPAPAAGLLNVPALTPITPTTAPVAAMSSADQVNQTPVVVTASDLIAWNRIRTKLTGTPGVSGLQIKSFTSGQASILLSHNGDISAIKPALAVRGLDLIGDGTNWEIKEK